jgi:hypothetical protein
MEPTVPVPVRSVIKVPPPGIPGGGDNDRD